MTDEKVLPEDMTVDLTEETEDGVKQPVNNPITDKTLQEMGIDELGLKFQPPDADAPGYFALRKRVYNMVATVVDSGSTPRTIDGVIDFLLTYIVEPEDRAIARYILENRASKQHYLTMMGALIRCEGEEIFPFRISDSSEDGSGEKATPRPQKHSSSNNHKGSA